VAFGMFLVFIGLFALGKPYALFLSYILFIPFLQIYRFFSKNSIFSINALKDIIFILIILALILNFLLKTHASLNIHRDNKYNLIMLIFIGYMLMQILRTPNMIVGILGFREVVEFMFAFFLGQFFFRTEDRIKKCLLIIFISGVVVALIGILQQITGLHYTHKIMQLAGLKLYRVTSTLGDPNTCGFFLTISILIAINYLFDKPKKCSRFFMLSSIVLMVICLFFTYSRTAVVALGIGIVFISIMKGNIKILVISSLIVITILTFMQPELLFRFKKITALDWGRRLMWASTLKQFEQHPVIGIGYGKVGGLYAAGKGSALEKIIAESTGSVLVVDNSYLFLLSETGIIGFGLFCLLFMFILKKSWFSIKKLKSSYLRSLSICLFSIFLAISIGAVNFNIFGMVFPVNFYFWLLAGIMVNLKNIDLALKKQEVR